MHLYTTKKNVEHTHTHILNEYKPEEYECIAINNTMTNKNKNKSGENTNSHKFLGLISRDREYYKLSLHQDLYWQ